LNLHDEAPTLGVVTESSRTADRGRGFMLYADAHCHTNPVKGLGASTVAKKFREVGGWFAALVSLPPYHYGLTGGKFEDYVKAAEILLAEKRKFEEAGIKVKAFMGFHPAEVDEYAKRGMDPQQILNLAESVLNLVVKYCREGLLDGIGEVGRQHYSTAPARLVLSELILLRALTYARDHDLSVHLHLEQGGFTTVYSIKRLAELTGVRSELLLFHHVDYSTGLWCERENAWYTVPAKLSDLRKAMSERRSRLLVESDYIDDLRRPGVSSYPWDIAVNVNRLLEEHVTSEDYVYRVMIDNITRFYRVEPP